MILDPFRYIVWQFLPIKDVLNYALVNSEFYEIWTDNDTWKVLTLRDIGTEQDLEFYQTRNQLARWKKNIFNDSPCLLELINICTYHKNVFYGVELPKPDSEEFIHKRRIISMLYSLSHKKREIIIGSIRTNLSWGNITKFDTYSYTRLRSFSECIYNILSDMDKVRFFMLDPSPDPFLHIISSI